MSVVAIDGPAGAGKSTVARRVAGELGFAYLDTGAMYRAVALGALEREVPLEDAERLADLVSHVFVEEGSERICLDGRDVSDRIRENDVTAAVSKVAAHPEVRTALVERQRKLAGEEDVVMEGRDIATTVAPDAAVKIFLSASLEERARRRLRQLDRSESDVTLAELGDALAARDRADAGRSVSPFAKAPDAIEIDSTNRDIEEVVRDIVAAARGRLRGDH
ncbi:MAG: (d)CMP kinase [Actinomycetota bacterium]